MESAEPSETNLVLMTRRERCKMFCTVYWRTLVIVITPIVLFPIPLITGKNAYKSLYVFLITVVYWVTDVIHPGVIALVPVAYSSVISIFSSNLINEMFLRNDVIDCICVMMIMAAIEYSKIQLRAALKILLIFGCSHYRLSFLLFFSTMFLSMWISSTLACGVMMVLTKAILIELEMLGLLELFENTGKTRKRVDRYEQSLPKPSKFTVFYFLGIAYSSSIGEMATVMGSQGNQIFKIYCETLFPTGPKIEFPQFMLLNLPGVLVMETLLYMWMNFYFLGLFRSQSEVAIEVGMTEEEAQYVATLLAANYEELGKISFHEMVVSSIVLLNALVQAALNTVVIDRLDSGHFHDHLRLSSTGIVCVVVLFLTPVNLNHVKFFRRHDAVGPLPTTQSMACLNWDLLESEVQWSVPFIISCSSAFFESFRDSDLVGELEKFLILFEGWPQTIVVLIVMLLCKVFTEFASNCSVVYALLPTVGKASVACRINPHYLMMAATLGCSLPFHLIPGAPVNAMVCAYVHISPWTMMYAGIGPSLIAVAVTWITAVIWSKAIWTDITVYPEWADVNIFKYNL